MSSYYLELIFLGWTVQMGSKRQLQLGWKKWQEKHERKFCSLPYFPIKVRSQQKLRRAWFTTTLAEEAL